MSNASPAQMGSALRLALQGNPAGPLVTYIQEQQGETVKTFRHAWKSSSKHPGHLSFSEGGKIEYMRDGILTVSNGKSGSYQRVKEFDGPARDEHEVLIRINDEVWNGTVQLVSEP